MRRGVWWIAWGVGLVFAGAAAGQPDTEAQLETTEQTVRVDDSAADVDIAERLREIFTASGRYDGLVVEVRDGIVFIDGVATQDDHKQWATDLARRTEDVVAVVNNLEVVPPPVLEQVTFTAELIDIGREALRSLPWVGLGLVILAVSLVVAWLVVRLIDWPLRRATDSRLLRNVARKAAGLVVVVAGVVLFLRVSGLTAVALTVLSGTGLFGLIVGFAFRDIAENFLASILLSVQTPFRLGDVIEVAGYTGVVQKVTPRGTVLVDFDGNHIQIANSTVYKSTLKNLTANPQMRVQIDLGIGYDASVKRAQEVVMDLLRGHSAVLDDPEPMVLVDTLGAATINLRIYFWIDGHEHSLLKIKSAVVRRALRAVERAGISLPDEAREVIFPQGVPVAGGGGEADREAVERASAEQRQRRDDAAAADLAEETTEAEGGLTSEVPEIREQAARSREPEGGPGIVD
ncbi:MAG: mechanosensitive ion channel family protein [Planctomycetota bacterium]